MRILVVSQYFYPENFAINEMVFDLRKRGHHVEVLTGQPNYGFQGIPEGYENVFEQEVNGVLIHRVKIHPRKSSSMKDLLLNYYSFWHNAKKAVRKLKGPFDVVYSMSFSPLIGVVSANKAAKRFGIKNVLHVLDLWPASPVAVGAVKEGSLFYRFLYRWSRRIYEKADMLLLSSPSFEDYFKNVIKTDRPLMYLAQPALAVSPIGEGKMDEQDFNIVYSGNIGNLQLVENLVQGLSLLPMGNNIHLHLFGGGSRLAEVRKTVIEKGLSDKVTIYGRVDTRAVSSYQGHADALVVSLHDDGSPVSETLPNKLLTSLYHGKPILGVIGGDGRKVLEDAKGSVLSESESPSDISKAMATLSSLSKEDREKMGKANRLYYDTHFEFSKLMDELENVLSKFAKKD